MFYQTAWFLALWAAAAVVVVGAAWRLHVLRVRKQFALLLGERARLSREIHDTLLQSLFGFALQCDAIANAVAVAAPDLKAQFMRMRLDVEEDIREARQSIWNLRSPRLESHGLADALRDMGEHISTPARIDFSMTVSGESRPYSANVEEQLLRIAREAMLNVVRHARAGTVRMQLSHETDQVSLSVADDGAGFDPSAAPDNEPHYGLTTMRERAETVGGTVHIASVIGQGTEVRTVIPHA
jgi:signal transduction histidine kinase